MSYHGRNAHARMSSRQWRGVIAAVLTLGIMGGAAATAQAGPLVLMGIDAEDGGVGGHGPIGVYQNVVNNGVLANVTNGGSGILVIGAGKNPGDNVTSFWNAIDSAAPGAITYVNGASNIASQSLAGFAMIAVASSVIETFDGGLTPAENTALAGRQADIASFVNGGGGLMGLSQTGLPDTYAYLPDAGQFTFDTALGYSDITATIDGSAVGIDDSLDICCWHDAYTSHPAFLKVLATETGTARAAALGGAAVIVPTDITLTPPSATNPVGTSHTVTANVRKGGVAQAGVAVTFKVAGVNAGATGTCVPANCTTNASGNVTFTYVGTTAGTDTIDASFVNAQNVTVKTSASKLWAAAAKLSINDVTVSERNSGFVDATFKVTLDQAVTTPVTVSYATANGTATAPADYTAKSGLLTFAANDQSEDVSVQVRGDTVNEPDETFTVTLSAASGASIQRTTGVGTILDDERDGAFTCRATGLRLLGLLEVIVANPPGGPCRDMSAALVNLNRGSGAVATTLTAPTARTDQTPNDLAAAAPAVGDKATAHADTANVLVGLGLSATATVADATALCSGSGAPALSSAGKVVGLRVNGRSYSVLTEPVTIPLLLATLRINATTSVSGQITRRAIWLDNVLLPDVIIGEASAGHSGNPCGA